MYDNVKIFLLKNSAMIVPQKVWVKILPKNFEYRRFLNILGSVNTWATY